MPMIRPLVGICLVAATAGIAVAQTAAPSPAAQQARCSQLLAYWDRQAGAKGEGGGMGDMPRKAALADCTAGRFEAGIRTLEDLLRRNGYTVPPP
jgi:hypothetical protein